MAAGKNEINMTYGNMVTKIIRFSVPLIFSGIIQLLFHTADTVVVGRFAGEVSLAAVGACGSLINLIVGLFTGLSLGATIVISNYFGEKNQDGMQKATHTAVAMSFLSGVFLAILGNIIATPVLRLMGSPEDVIDLAALYMRVYFAGMPFNMAYNFTSGIMRSYGDTKRPLYYLFTAGIINVALNLVFVIYFKMNVAGVALATIISQAVSSVLALRALATIDNGCRLSFKKLYVHKKELLMMVCAGIPAGIQSCMFSLSNTIIQSALFSLGTIALAGASASSSITAFVFAVINAVSATVVTATAQNYGAKDFKRILQCWRICQVYSFVSLAFMGIIIYVFARPLLLIFTNSEDVIFYGLQHMHLYAPLFILYGMMDMSVACLRGMGCTTVPMIVSIFGICGLRIMWVYTIFAAYPTFVCLYLGAPVTWLIVGIIQTVLFFAIKKKKEKQYTENIISISGQNVG